MIRSRSGVALVLALVAIVLLHSVVAVALWATLNDVRAVAAARRSVEGEMIATSALASARLTHDSTLAALRPGEVVLLPAVAIADWSVLLSAAGHDSLVLLSAVAELRTASDSLLAASSRTLVMARDASDTLRVLRGRSRF